MKSSFALTAIAALMSLTFVGCDAFKSGQSTSSSSTTTATTYDYQTTDVTATAGQPTVSSEDDGLGSTFAVEAKQANVVVMSDGSTWISLTIVDASGDYFDYVSYFLPSQTSRTFSYLSHEIILSIDTANSQFSLELNADGDASNDEIASYTLVNEG